MTVTESVLTPAHLSPISLSFPISVLLIDDQKIVAEAVYRMLADQKDINFHYSSEPNKALEFASKVKPTVILLDLVMPGCDGKLLTKYFRANPATKDIPIIVLSTKEEAQTKAELFGLGVNDYVVKLPDKLELLARIRYHSKGYISLLERNEAYNRLQENQRVLNAQLAEAASYVRSLLPLPVEDHIKISWRFIPSAQLGGDAFGYHWLDEDHFAMYLLDVCGHGVGAALLSISVVNILLSSNLPKADFYDPSSVLKELNDSFQMEKHNNMFFTIWYGVYNKKKKEIIYSTGGHPPALLLTGDNSENAKNFELKTNGVVIGALPIAEFENATVSIKEFNRLYIFSDGVYEIVKKDGEILQLHEFLNNLIQLVQKNKKNKILDQVIKQTQEIYGKEYFADDFSILEVIF